MKLNLHVGTEKTGSSYLQKLCGRNRRFLQENGLWFPDAGEYEKRLQKGTISPGNARDLAQLIHCDCWAEVASWIESRANEAQQRECQNLLLSHELLFAEMSREGAVGKLQAAAADVGIGEVSCLLLIRDPIDQALSLYKHRAKSGRIADVEGWIQEGYSLPGELDDFLRQIDESRIQLYMRKYTKNTASLTDVFFRDWLGVDDPPTMIQSLVNPSLSLSELAVIRHVVASRPDDRRAFYSKFLAVPLDQKADDREIEIALAGKIENFLCQFGDVWKQLDTRLSSDGGIEIPRQRQDSAERAYRYSFSAAQIQTLSDAHAQAATFRYAVGTLLHRLGIGRYIGKAMSRLRKM